MQRHYCADSNTSHCLCDGPRAQATLRNLAFLSATRSLENEKMFSIFETCTWWISKGKAGTPVARGVPVCALEDISGFFLHREVMQ